SALQSASAELLEALLDELHFERVYTPKQLASLQAMQRSLNAKNKRPLEADMPRRREPDPGAWLFDPEIDSALARAMFDGKPGIFRLKMIELITQRTYPEELPRLRARLVASITDP